MTPNSTAAKCLGMSVLLSALLAALAAPRAGAAEGKAKPAPAPAPTPAATPTEKSTGGKMVQIFDPKDSGEKDAAGKAEAGKAKAGPVAPRSMLSTLARTGFWLGLVVVLLCGLVLMAKRVLPRSMGMFRSPAMELLGRSYLDPKRCVYLLKVGGRLLVVGSAENGLTCLSEIADADEVEHLTTLTRNGQQAAGGGKRGFAAALGSRLSRLAGMVRRGGEQVEAGAEDLDLAAPGEKYDFADRTAPASGMSELREKVEGLKARLKTIS